MKKLSIATVLAFALGWAPAAMALPNFPYVTAEHLGMTCMPKCSLCHLSNPGNGGNAVQPFAKTLRVPGKPVDDNAPRTQDELIAALDALASAEAVAEPDLREDSDFDATSDLEELATDPPTDPNGLDPEICQPSTRYGCGAARLAAASSNDSQAWLPVVLPLLGAALLIGRRQKRERRTSRAGTP